MQPSVSDYVVSVGTGVTLGVFASSMFSGTLPDALCYLISTAVCLGSTLFLMQGKAPKPLKGPYVVGEDEDILVQYQKGRKHYTCQANGSLEIQFAKNGPSSKEEHPVMTLLEVFEKTVGYHGNKLALAIERPCPPPERKGYAPSLPDCEWKKWTWSQYYNDAKRAARAMMNFGIEQFGSVAVFGFNSPEWVLSCVGAIFCGAKVAGIYPTDSIEHVSFKIKHSGSAILVIEDKSKLDRLISELDNLPKLKTIVTWAYKSENKTITTKNGEIMVLHWDEFLEFSSRVSAVELDARQAKIQGNHCCALVYTSGTTGNPKAVMISHDNIIAECHILLDLWSADFEGRREDFRILSYLPLSHVAGMLFDIMAPVHIGYITAGHGVVYFARPYDLKEATIGARLTHVRPNLFLGVPRVWEKFMEKLLSIGAKTKGTKKAIATWAKSKAFEHSQNCMVGGSGEYPLFHGLAHDVILSKVKAAMGLDQCGIAVTAAAPIHKEVLEYFGSLGICMNELYGMTECTGAAISSLTDRFLWGSCGLAPRGSEVRIFKVDDVDYNKKTECPKSDDIFHPSEEEQGEICVRGRHVMMGYLANPELGAEHVAEIEKKTKDSIDDDGWLHTGDKGVVGKNGMFRITGRYKELIIGSGGENIAPVPIEDNIKKLCPAISNVMMVGDKRKYNVVLVTLKAEGATGEFPGNDNLAGAALGVVPDIKTVSAAMESAAYKKVIEKAIVDTNNDPLVCVSQPCKIQKFEILFRDFSIQTGEFTPTLKLKRSVASEIWKEAIEKMY